MEKTNTHSGWPRERVFFKSRPREYDESFESLRLKLAALKENSEYQKFYEKIKTELPSFDPIRETEENDHESLSVIFRRIFDESKASCPPFFLLHCQKLDFDIEKLSAFLKGRKVSLNEVLHLLDPQKDIEKLSSFLPAPRVSYLENIILPMLFEGSPAVVEYTIIDPLAEWLGVAPQSALDATSRPYRLYLVDLRKGKSQIEREFERHLKRRCKDKSGSFKKDDRGRPPKAGLKSVTIYQQYSDIENKLDDFLRNCKDDGIKSFKRREYFEMKFPELSEDVSEVNFSQCRSVKEIAKAIVCAKWDVSRRELIAILKSTKQELDRICAGSATENAL